MVLGRRTWAVAVRASCAADAGGAVQVLAEPLDPWSARHRAARLPVVRGVAALAESLRVGARAWWRSGGPPPRAGVAAPLLGLALLMVAPAGLAAAAQAAMPPVPAWLVEGVLRVALVPACLAALGRLPRVRRVLEYHGAEHKAIACLEAGEPLEPESAQRFSRLHPRCGAGYLLVLAVVAGAVLAPLGLPDWPWAVASRLLGGLLAAGLAFEVVRLAARDGRHAWSRWLAWPGLQVQRLSTREPDQAQLAVAIAAVQAVLEREQGPRDAT